MWQDWIAANLWCVLLMVLIGIGFLAVVLLGGQSMRDIEIDMAAEDAAYNRRHENVHKQLSEYVDVRLDEKDGGLHIAHQRYPHIAAHIRECRECQEKVTELIRTKQES